MAFRHPTCGGKHDHASEARECERDIEVQREMAEAEAEAERRHEEWLENGGPHAEQIAWENAQDLLREQFHAVPVATRERVSQAELDEAHEQAVQLYILAGGHGPGSPCGCSWHDRCHYQRLRDMANAPTRNAGLRAYARAYND